MGNQTPTFQNKELDQAVSELKSVGIPHITDVQGQKVVAPTRFGEVVRATMLSTDNQSDVALKHFGSSIGLHPLARELDVYRKIADAGQNGVLTPKLLAIASISTNRLPKNSRYYREHRNMRDKLFNNPQVHGFIMELGTPMPNHFNAWTKHDLDEKQVLLETFYQKTGCRQEDDYGRNYIRVHRENGQKPMVMIDFEFVKCEKREK